MLYSYFVKKLIRQSFDHVNNHSLDRPQDVIRLVREFTNV
jgi:hypothetical protein